MRCTDEQLRLVRDRAEALRRRRERLLQRGAAAACLVLMASLGLLLSGRSGGASLAEGGAFGSIVLVSPVLGYIVAAVLAFVLGVSVTLLCLRHRGEGDSPEDEDS